MLRRRSATVLVLLLAALAGFALGSGCGKKKPKYPTCSSDKECKAGEKCVDKACVECATDKDCAPGNKCVENSCQRPEGACTTDAECKDGQVCKNNVCSACQADGECGPGGRCQAGKCLRPGDCSVDEDCADDEDCVSGKCVKGGRATTGDTPKCELQPVFFDFDASTLRDDARSVLEANAACLKQTSRGVALDAFTDPRGTDEYNVALSDQRGRIVFDYLTRLGINASRMRVVPRGEAGASGTDEGGWSRDRRVEFRWE